MTQPHYTTAEIVLCPTCNGRGYRECRELEDYHNNTFFEWKAECARCRGAGRLLKRTAISFEQILFDPEIKASNWRPE